MLFCCLLPIFLCLKGVQAQYYGGSSFGSPSGQVIRLGE